MRKLIRITTISLSLHTLLKGQLAFLKQSYHVIGVASGIDLLKEVGTRENIRVINVPIERDIRLIKDLYSLYLLIKLFWREKPYIVHANTPKASLLSMIAAWLTGVPHRIYTVTGLRFESVAGRFRWLLIFMERITCLCATKVIPEGEGVKKTLISEKITKKPLKVILHGNINGVDIQYFNRTEEVVRKALVLKICDKFTFCFVGRIVQDKGINELVQAFDRLYKQNRNICLFLVGSFEDKLDPLLPDTVDFILHHPAISYMGFQQDIRPYLVASDALVFPSYREGFPNVVLQAGALGLPSIVTDINGCNEIIIDGVNGMIIPVGDENALFNAMLYFVDHRFDDVINMANKSRDLIVDRFEQKKLWNALLEEYNTLE